MTRLTVGYVSSSDWSIPLSAEHKGGLTKGGEMIVGKTPEGSWALEFDEDELEHLVSFLIMWHSFLPHEDLMKIIIEITGESELFREEEVEYPDILQ